ERARDIDDAVGRRAGRVGRERRAGARRKDGGLGHQGSPFKLAPFMRQELSHVNPKTRHPDRSEAKWRDLFMGIFRQEQVPRLRFAPLGMTEKLVKWDGPNFMRLGGFGWP